MDVNQADLTKKSLKEQLEAQLRDAIPSDKVRDATFSQWARWQLNLVGDCTVAAFIAQDHVCVL